MTRTPPVNGMFGIKLVGHEHHVISQGTNGGALGREGMPSLMNFPDSREGREIARTIPVGYKSLVYLQSPVMRIWAAIEYIKWDPNESDLLAEGMRAAMAQKVQQWIAVTSPRFAKYWRCVRFLAEINDPQAGPVTEFDFHQGEGMYDMTREEYCEWVSRVRWTWEADPSGDTRS